ncbi:MAG: FHA domain-containing protein [Gammaproteobacteria bacterium]
MINIIETEQVLTSNRVRARRKTDFAKAKSAVVITVDGAIFRYSSVDEFSAAIEGRTAIPTALYAELTQLNQDELTLLAQNLKHKEKQLIELLERALTSPNVLSTEINRIPLTAIRNEHFWREIIISLCDLDADEVYLQTAILKYLQFLNSFQEIVRLLFAVNAGGKKLLAETVPGEASEAPYETALFDVLQYSDAGRMVNPFRRLPQGEAVTLHALPGHAINLLLAKYSFELVNRNGWSLIDSKNREFRLTNDLNYVGRGRENDILLNGEYRNISRKHVIVHPLDDSSVVLIDLSSHGTFVPPRQVELSPPH